VAWAGAELESQQPAGKIHPVSLFDAYGRPIVFEALREEQAAPTLLGIRNIYSSDGRYTSEYASHYQNLRRR
jgi:hypothetical protein